MSGGETTTCQSCRSAFAIEPEDLAFYEKVSVPPPTWCPSCRAQRRMAWRNERTLYQRQCGLCTKDIITVYAPDGPLTVYCSECWHSDAWDAMEFGADIDWSKDFFTQFADLLGRTPLILADRKQLNTNSDYSNFIGNCKDCFLTFSAASSENVYYSYSIENCTDCADASFAHGDELCYGNTHTVSNHRSRWLVGSQHCADSSFLLNCRNSTDCFLSSNLNNRQYVFGNEQLTKEAYADQLQRFDLGSYQILSEAQARFRQLRGGAITKYATIVGSSDATGNDIMHSSNVTRSFWVSDSEDVHYSLRIMHGSKEIWDVYGLAQGELIYEGFGGGFKGYHNLFSFSVDTSRYLAYSAFCHGSSNLFGCVGLRGKQYCIFNKQYSKEEYEALVPRLLQHMNELPYVDSKGREYRYGEFFPAELSPFAYNETVAHEYYPLTPEQVADQGWRWRMVARPERSISLAASDLPDHIRDVTDDVYKETIGCAHQGDCTHQCTTAFKVVPQELELYRRLEVPVPRLCPNCRHHEHFEYRRGLTLTTRQCQCAGTSSSNRAYSNRASDHPSHAPDQACSTQFETSIAPDAPDIVYCEECYQQEMAS